MTIEKERLEKAVADLKGGLDGDVAVMLQLLGGLGRNPESAELHEMLENEIKLIKKRVTWDLVASQMGVKYTIDHYGTRP